MNINDLPPELKELAKKRIIEQCKQDRLQGDSKGWSISTLFSWNSTSEGAKFWNDVNDGKDIEKHNEYAKTIVGALTLNYSIF